MSELKNEIKIELISENDNSNVNETSKTYVYTNKKGKSKVVKRKYNVTATNARNPEIKQRIIDVITKNKEEISPF